MFEIAVQDGDIKVVPDEHYELVYSTSTHAEDLALYAGRRRGTRQRCLLAQGHEL